MNGMFFASGLLFGVAAMGCALMPTVPWGILFVPACIALLIGATMEYYKS